MATSTTTAPSVPPAPTAPVVNQQLATEYQQRKERTAALTDLTLASTDGMSRSPTPTQEENDKLALGLMHPDEKSLGAQEKAMPPLEAQRAYLRDGTALPTAPTTAGTTGATGASGASGASGATGATG